MGGLSLLVQGGPPQCPAIPSLEFTHKYEGRRACPHDINISATPVIKINDPLVKVLAPTPRSISEPKAYVLRAPDLKLVNHLIELCSPTENLIWPIWTRPPRLVAKQAAISNCIPLVLTGVDASTSGAMEQITTLMAGMTRRVLFVGPDRMFPPKGGELLETKLTLADVESAPLRELGASMLRDYMLDRTNAP